MDLVDSQHSRRPSSPVEAAVSNENTEEITLSKKTLYALVAMVFILCASGITGLMLLSNEKSATVKVHLLRFFPA